VSTPPAFFSSKCCYPDCCADLPPGHTGRHLKVLACEVLAREYYYCAARSINTCEVHLFTQGLHDNPEICRAHLQPAIDAARPEQFVAVVLGYGLCNNALVGLAAGRVPLIVPRAHDCITLFLGSRERYARVFEDEPGTYFYTSGWLEYPHRGGERVEHKQQSGLAKRQRYEEIVEKYGEENARFLLEQMSAWEVNYTRGLLIEMPFCAHLPLAERVAETCRRKGWRFERVAGDLSLVQDSLDGKWDERFLTVHPGEEIAADYAAGIIASRPAGRQRE